MGPDVCGIGHRTKEGDWVDGYLPIPFDPDQHSPESIVTAHKALQGMVQSVLIYYGVDL